MNSVNQLIYIQDSTNIYYIKSITDVAPTKAATVTEYATVAHNSISDHVYYQPVNMVISFFVSDMTSFPTVYYYRQGNIIKLSVENVKNLINSWYRNADRLTVQTRTESFDNMVINNISWTENDQSKGLINYRLGLREVRISEIKTTHIEIAQEKVKNPGDELSESTKNEIQQLVSDEIKYSSTTIWEEGAQKAAQKRAEMGDFAYNLAYGQGPLPADVLFAFESLGEKLFLKNTIKNRTKKLSQEEKEYYTREKNKQQAEAAGGN